MLRGMRTRKTLASVVAALLLATCATASRRPGEGPPRNVIVLVWDGLRPDFIGPDTPNLVALRDSGVDFTDHHSTYPTFTMMNAASLATGAFPGTVGFYGNVLWQPEAKGKDSAGKEVDFRQPVFSEDYAVLDDLGRNLGGHLFLAGTLFEAAQKAGMRTVTMGKAGAAYVNDYRRGGTILDEKTAWPLAFAKKLQAAGVPVPSTTPLAYAKDEISLASANGNPTELKAHKRLADGVSFDPTDTEGSRNKSALQYMVSVYLDHLLPEERPRLSLLWLRDPDSTQHNYGLGSDNVRDALRSNDALLGRISAKLAELGLAGSTDILVVSDHGHSNVAAPTSTIPLRAIRAGAPGDVDPDGYSVSGLVRLADLLRRAGLTAFDGQDCTFAPVASGIKTDGTSVYPTLVDEDGSKCGKPGQKYQIGRMKVPGNLPPGAIVVAVNGGSDYLYVPDRDPETVRKAVRVLQGRSEIGAIFVDDAYRDIPGTLPLSAIQAENAAHRNPDVIASYDFDEDAAVRGARGIEYAGGLLGTSYRGMHGSFSPRDIHNTFLAAGPDFRPGFKDRLPTGNVDVAPTVAAILGVELPDAQGRPVLEAFRRFDSPADYQLAPAVVRPEREADGLSVALATDPSGKDLDASKTKYTFELRTKQLSYNGKTYTYFDSAKVQRR
ncbi:MAG: phosphodiesterase [Deltaproteobacteria bacterium]|nr:MAG: phosphodiesterase [Deltaproteobacteria bacterium]